MRENLSIHADDYGVSSNASKEILELIRQGCLNGISVIPNMSCFETDMIDLCKELQVNANKIDVSIHLNLMEGACISDRQQAFLLVNQEGYFSCSWGQLLLASFGRKRKLYKEQIKQEFVAQIRRVSELLPKEVELRVDSHQHTHMIPVVWDALVEVLRENAFEIEGVRIPIEPIQPYLKNISLIASYPFINFVKNIILRLLAVRARWVAREYYDRSRLVWGLLMTGCMDGERVQKLRPYFEQYARRHDKTIEVIFHPGQTLAGEISEEYTKTGFIEDHLSRNRKIEWKSVRDIKNERENNEIR